VAGGAGNPPNIHCTVAKRRGSGRRRKEAGGGGGYQQIGITPSSPRGFLPGCLAHTAVSPELRLVSDAARDGAAASGACLSLYFSRVGTYLSACLI
jgi:hypothetical protein